MEQKLFTEVSEKIVARQKKLKITDRELDRRSGVSAQSIKQLRAGMNNGMTLQTLEKLAYGLNLEVKITFKEIK